MPQNSNIVLFSIFCFTQCWFVFILVWITKHIITRVNIALKSKRKFVQLTLICSYFIASCIPCVSYSLLTTEIVSLYALTEFWWQKWYKVLSSTNPWGGSLQTWLLGSLELRLWQRAYSNKKYAIVPTASSGKQSIGITFS